MHIMVKGLLRTEIIRRVIKLWQHCIQKSAR